MSETRIAVLGAAHKGRQLATDLAAAGFEVVFDDLMPGNTELARTEIFANLKVLEHKGEIASAAETLSRIEFVPELEDLMRSSLLVFEAGPDDLESKLEMFSLLERICMPGTTIVSTAHNFSVSFVASVTMRHASIVEMHREKNGVGGERIVLNYTNETSQQTLDLVLPVLRKLCSDVVTHLETADEATK